MTEFWWKVIDCDEFLQLSRHCRVKTASRNLCFSTSIDWYERSCRFLRGTGKKRDNDNPAGLGDALEWVFIINDHQVGIHDLLLIHILANSFSVFVQLLSGYAWTLKAQQACCTCWSNSLQQCQIDLPSAGFWGQINLKIVCFLFCCRQRVCDLIVDWDLAKPCDFSLILLCYKPVNDLCGRQVCNLIARSPEAAELRPREIEI